MTYRSIYVYLIFAGMIFSTPLIAAPIAQSGPVKVSLLEVYSSEGCSSCPPAEKWVSGLSQDPGLWKDFVPVAFHVDYWNQLGWPDRFSTREFTQRQYALAAAWGGGSVYTPCFVRDGAEWRPAGERAPPAGSSSGGILDVLLTGATMRIDFTPVVAQAKGEFEVHVALLGGGFVSKVTAGENSGATLRQEFVALALAVHPLVAGSPALHAEFPLPAVVVKAAPRRALAAWVTKRGNIEPLQATGGWIRP